MKRFILGTCVLGSVWAAVAQTPAPAPAAAPAAINPRVAQFTELLRNAQGALESLLPEELITLLQEGRDIGQPQMVAGVLRGYLSRRADPGPRILRLAAENAKLVGDYPVAASRYRQFLQIAPVDADSSLAAGELFQILSDYMGKSGEAWTANKEFGDKFRQAALPKQYDGAYLDGCFQTRATAAMAKRLLTIFSEKLPLEQERFAYWHHLDGLISRLESVYPGNADAIIPARALVPLIRADPTRQARLAFLIENIAFHETRAGRDASTLARAIEPVIAAARTYLDCAPTANTLRQVMAALAGGPDLPAVQGRQQGQPDSTIWSAAAEQKSEFFVTTGFSKLPEAEQITFLNWSWAWLPAGLATADQWIALGGKHPQAFQKAVATARLPWITQATNMAVYKAQAPFLAGQTFYNAAVINALAAANDPNGSFQHLLAQESWYLPFLDERKNEAFPYLVVTQLIPAWVNLKGLPTTTDRNAYAQEAQMAFLEGLLLNSVMTPFSPQHIRQALLNAWNYCSTDAVRRNRFIAILGKLDWTPFVPAPGVERREQIFEAARTAFRGWSQTMRKQAESLAGKASEADVKRRVEMEAVVNQIAKIEEAFQQAIAAKVDPARAPNQQCRDIAMLIQAVDAGDAAAYAPLAKSLYASIREYQKNKTPFGEALLEFLMTPRADALACLDAQIDILADQLAIRMDNTTQRGALVCMRMIAKRSGWGIDASGVRPRAEDNELRDKLAAVLAKAVQARSTKDVWDGDVFSWYRGLARRDGAQAQAVLAEIIDRDIFTKNNISPSHASPVCSYLWLVREFPVLQSKYPSQSWFDERMAAEIKRTWKVDQSYWTYAGDTQKKVANAIAEKYASDTSYAVYLGAPGKPAVVSRDEYNAALERIKVASGAAYGDYQKKVEAEFGKTRFDSLAAGQLSITEMPIKTPEERKAFFDKLRAYVVIAKNAPYPLSMPALPQVSSLKVDGPVPLKEDEIQALAGCLRYTRWTSYAPTDESLILLVNDGLLARDKIAELLPLIPEMWRIAASQPRPNTMAVLGGITSKLLQESKIVPAAAHSAIGLAVADSRLPNDIRSTLYAIRTKMQALVGEAAPVAMTDRRYTILTAQTHFQAGRTDSAWNLYNKNPSLALTEFKDLDMSFLIWIIQRLTELDQYEPAEKLAQTLLSWIEEAPQGFDTVTRAEMLIVYADIAFRRQQYPQAKAQYERVAANKEFADTQGGYRAELKIAEVDRLMKAFDAALERLGKLDRLNDASIQAEARYQMALVAYDQEDYGGARDQLARVFTLSPNHIEATLLEGKVNVKTGKLVEGTDLRISPPAEEQNIIPGRPFKVNLEDKNLSIVRKATDIEMRVWTDSGDEEHFMLFPFGDSKTRFRGEIPTAMAGLVKGDHILQVLGGDKVHFGLSERFRKQANITRDTVGHLGVITDGALFTSSGSMPTLEEQARIVLETSLRGELEKSAQSEGNTSLLQALNAPKEGAGAEVVLSAVRSTTEIKPGNPVYIRVVDQDRNTTPQKDTITVKAMATSGDKVNRVVLTETDTHSGLFEGKLATLSAPATAFASDTLEGRDPTSVIVPDSTLLPWAGADDDNRSKTFTVDMKDNIAFGKLTLTADVPSRKLKRFALETSMNGSSFSAVGSWPIAAAEWDGSLRLRLINYGLPATSIKGTTAAENMALIKDYFDVGRLQFDNPIATMPGKMTGDLSQTARAADAKLGGKSASGLTLAHLQGSFYVAKRQKRIFNVQTTRPPETEPAAKILPTVKKYLAIDGAQGLLQKGPNPESLGQIFTLTRGYHTLDLYALIPSDATEGDYQILWDVDADPYVAPVPDTIFTSAEWPEHQAPPGFKPTEIKANANGTVFDVAFAPESRGRTLRLRIFDFEAARPEIRKIALTDVEGKQILPSKDNLIGMRTNDILEIVPGDKITITYEDTAALTPARKILESFLSATFFNASLQAYLIESDVTKDGERRALLMPNNRFRPDLPMAIMVTDPDADETAAPDKVQVHVRSTITGNKTDLVLLETKPVSGAFAGRFFPIVDDPKRGADIKTSLEDDLVITYRDKENLDYGIPWDRVAQLQPPLEWMKSQMRVFDFSSKPLGENMVKKSATAQAAAKATDKKEVVTETIRPGYSLTGVRPESPIAKGPVKIPFCGTLTVELLNPYLAFSALSEAEISVQILPAGMQPAVANGAPFDPSLPGTIRYRALLGGGGDGASVPLTYEQPKLIVDKFAGTVQDDGRYMFKITTAPGSMDQMKMPTYQDPEEEGVEMGGFGVQCITEDGKSAIITRKFPWPTLRVRPDDRLRVALNNAPAGAEPTWEVWDVTMFGDPMFDVMDQRYQAPLTELYVGDRLYLRVVDLMANRTMEKDTVDVSVVINGVEENANKVSLMETFENTGVYKSSLKLVYEGMTNETRMADEIGVPYGATITLRYTDRDGRKLDRALSVFKGSDALVMPFTKRFNDASVAVQTQFTMAESYFELAKKYRALKEDEAARRTIAQGKKLLEEAIRDFPKTEFRAQADYLLANLAFEEAEQTVLPEKRSQLYREAVTRFADVISGNAESEYAPKSQFKKALVYEKMGEIDTACEEYVKLSYRYPNHELVAETISRLGLYFFNKGRMIDKGVGEETDLLEKEKRKLQARAFYRTAAQVFGRLSARFPDHKLAASTKVLSAENWLRAKEFDKAITTYEAVIAEKKGAPDLIAQSMYWCGDAYMQTLNPTGAYRMFKLCTWDYPETKWARYARGKLTDKMFVEIDKADTK
jgi:tetratricopeptide (TPR) repeat protein